jgi:hypothetical protein
VSGALGRILFLDIGVHDLAGWCGHRRLLKPSLCGFS